MEHMIVVDFIGSKGYTIRGLIGKAGELPDHDHK